MGRSRKLEDVLVLLTALSHLEALTSKIPTHELYHHFSVIVRLQSMLLHAAGLLPIQEKGFLGDIGINIGLPPIPFVPLNVGLGFKVTV